MAWFKKSSIEEQFEKALYERLVEVYKQGGTPVILYLGDPMTPVDVKRIDAAAKRDAS